MSFLLHHCSRIMGSPTCREGCGVAGGLRGRAFSGVLLQLRSKELPLGWKLAHFKRQNDSFSFPCGSGVSTLSPSISCSVWTCYNLEIILARLGKLQTSLGKKILKQLYTVFREKYAEGMGLLDSLNTAGAFECEREDVKTEKPNVSFLFSSMTLLFICPGDFSYLGTFPWGRKRSKGFTWHMKK